MSELAQMKCVPCRGGVPALAEAEIAALQPAVPEWKVVEVDGIQRLERAFKLKNFVEAMALTNKIAMLAEEEDHHPLIVTEWGRVKAQPRHPCVGAGDGRRRKLPRLVVDTYDQGFA